MIVVTGGAGFIGSNIVRELNKLGHKNIMVVDNLAKSTKWRNLRPLQFTDYIHKSKFLDRLDVLGKITGIVHMGACSSTTEEDCDYLMENNFHYTTQLIQWSLAKGVRIIFASSGATYGGGEHGYSDDHTGIEKFRPLNRYGYSKHLVDLFCKENGLLDKVAALKFFNVYGPGEAHKGDMASVVYKSFQTVRDGGTIRLFKSYREDYKDGEQKRDFVYVKDCAKIVSTLLTKPHINGIFNVGTGQARSWNDLAHGVFKAMGKPAKIEYVPMPESLRPQYQYFTKAEDSKLLSAGLISKMTSLEDGILDYWQTCAE